MSRIEQQTVRPCPVCGSPVVLDAYGRISDHRAPGILYGGGQCLGVGKTPAMKAGEAEGRK